MSGFTVERLYPHPRERVWRALTDPELLARWLMPNDFRPELDHEFTFRTDPAPGFDGIVRCRVTELQPPERLVFTWAGGPIDTVVTFELHQEEAGTRLVMRQTGFRGPRAWLVGLILRAGSRKIYGRRLPEVLANHPSHALPLEVPKRECMSGWQKLAGMLIRRRGT